MQKTKINLIISREDYQKYEGFFYSLKILIFILIFIFLVIFVSFFIILNNENKVFNRLTDQKKFYLTALQEKKAMRLKFFTCKKNMPT